MDQWGRHYRASARPNNPAAPAKLMATPAVAIGAPPVEVEDEGVDDLEVEATVSVAEEPEEWALEPEVVAAVGVGRAATA